MYEISSSIVTLWTLGTFTFAMGFGWAGIKIGQKQTEKSVKDMKKDVSDIKKCVDSLKERLNNDEKSYMTRIDCRSEQDDCGKHRAYHESQLLGKLQELKELMMDMDNRRESTRLELSNAMRSLEAEVRTENTKKQGAVNG